MLRQKQYYWLDVKHAWLYKNANTISMVNLEFKRPLVRLKRRWGVNVKMDTKYCVCVRACRLEWRFVAKKYCKMWFALRHESFDQSGEFKFHEGQQFPQTYLVKFFDVSKYTVQNTLQLSTQTFLLLDNRRKFVKLLVIELSLPTFCAFAVYKHQYYVYIVCVCVCVFIFIHTCVSVCVRACVLTHVSTYVLT